MNIGEFAGVSCSSTGPSHSATSEAWAFEPRAPRTGWRLLTRSTEEIRQNEVHPSAARR